MANNKDMNPMSGEEVETTGVYANEDGREETLKRGDVFPSDLTLGKTEWELVSLPLESQEAELFKNTKANTEKRQHINQGHAEPNRAE
ncbi:hypothetical protein RAC89_13730 [Paenibacillus sp. GD4]|uniref:hypothetical protein n=1 Tax=Paenibacillus TaxID=44249 RepID=UPI002542A96F|nr:MULTISPECIES: hypothetical protein [Paenibacillus]MDQ1911496.1 hypothetical protein [Paenibacillus sp. GD4]